MQERDTTIANETQTKLESIVQKAETLEVLQLIFY